MMKFCKIKLKRTHALLGYILFAIASEKAIAVDTTYAIPEDGAQHIMITTTIAEVEEGTPQYHRSYRMRLVPSNPSFPILNFQSSTPISRPHLNEVVGRFLAIDCQKDPNDSSRFSNLWVKYTFTNNGSDEEGWLELDNLKQIQHFYTIILDNLVEEANTTPMDISL